jgi:pimeloyl-ACP methyl ester carboxylesterase
MTALPILYAGGAAAIVAAALALFTRRTARRIEAYLPPTGRFIDVPGARLHVREQGSGQPLLLVHGLAGQMAHFSYGVLERLAGEYRVVIVDRPGSGYSTRGAAAGASLAEQAQALAGLINTLQLERPLVVGHSLGGAVALTLALEHPDKVGALALVAPLTHAPEGVPAVFKALTIRSGFVRKLVAWTVATPASIARSSKTLAQVFGPEPAPADFATKGGGLLSLRPSQFLSASSDLQTLPDSMPALEARYGELKVPLAVLYGREDRLLDWQANGQALVDKVPGATLKLVDGGHMLPITQPDLTAGFIREAARAQAALQPPMAASRA